MTARKLKKMLKKAPFSGVFMILVLIASLILFLLIIIKSLEYKDIPSRIGTLLLTAGAVFGTVLIIRNISIILSKARKVRENGEKSLRFLESNGLLEAAVAEYNHPGKTMFRAVDRDKSMDKFISRHNTLTENFIFALSSNQIIGYQDAVRTYIVRYNDSETLSTEVFTVLTKDGEEIDLLSYTYSLLVKPPHELIDWICSVIKAKNPNCEVSSAVETVKNVCDSARSDS